MANRAQPTLNTLTDGVPIDTQSELDKINQNNEVISAKFGALTTDDLITSGQTTFTVNGAVDMRSNQITNVSKTMGVFNLETDGRSLKEIMDQETAPAIYVPGGFFFYEVDEPITIKSGSMIFGAGSSSVLRMSDTTAGAPSGFTMLTVDATCHDWSIRDIFLAGHRDTLNDSVGLKILNSVESNGEVENVFMGPLLDAAVTVAFHNPVEIRGSSGVRFTNVHIRGAENVAFLMSHTNNHTTITQDIDIHQCSIEQNSDHGIVMNGVKNVKISDSWIGESGNSNIYIDVSSHVIISNNDIYNANTAGLGNGRGLYMVGSNVTQSSALMIMSNHFVDKRAGPSAIPRSTDVQIYVDSYVTYITMMFNRITSCTGDPGNISWTAPLGRHHADSVVVQEKNVIGGGFQFLPNSNVNSVTWQGWKNMRDYVEPWSGIGYIGLHAYGDTVKIHNFSRTYQSNMSQPHDGVWGLFEDQARRVGMPNQYTHWDLGGLTDDGSYPSTKNVIDRNGNRGSSLTPERFTSVATTHYKSEVGAVIATYNLGPHLTRGNPDYADGTVIGTPNQQRNSQNTEDLVGDKIFGWQTDVTTVSATNMSNSVLCATFVNPNNLDVIGHPYKVNSVSNNNTVLVGRPTWITMKI